MLEKTASIRRFISFLSNALPLMYLKTADSIPERLIYPDFDFIFGRLISFDEFDWFKYS